MKDFNLNTSKVEQEAELATQAPVTVTPSEDERKARKRLTPEEMKALADKGEAAPKEKYPRMNMAFTPANYEFIMVASKARGESYTAFTNKIIEKYREQYKEQMEMAKALFSAFD